jgi:4-amino-4-deoxy-L-arabinose transferase-like glycosyltransferase
MALGILWTKWNKKEWQDSPGLFLLCWAFVPFVFFSLSQSKLPGYILPSIPPAVLLMGRTAARVFASDDRRRAAIWTGITGVLFVVLAGVLIRAPGVSESLSSGAASRTTGLVLLALAGGMIAVLLSLAQKPHRAFASEVLLVGALVLFMNLEILPGVDSRISARSIARDALLLIPPGGNVAVHGLNRNWNYGLSYYFNRELPEWGTDAAQPEWLFTSADHAGQFLRPQDQVLKMNNMAGVVLVHRLPSSDAARQSQ